MIDGSGMVRQPSPSVVVSGVGDAFVMNMRHERFGYYQMRSEIVEYEAGRRLVWEPMRVADPGEEGDVPDATMVTESFDCTRSDGDLREAVKEGEGWRDAMNASLVKLELLPKALDPA